MKSSVRSAISQPQSCPVTVVAEMLSDTWTMLILHTLLPTKGLRFCELERALPGMSTRTLTLKLKTLEQKGIIVKTDYGYSMTALGKEFRSVIRAMEKLGACL